MVIIEQTYKCCQYKIILVLQALRGGKLWKSIYMGKEKKKKSFNFTTLTTQ